MAKGVVLPCMFGNTYPIFEHETTLNDRIWDRGLRDYLRWEYRPADRASVILSARGGTVLATRRGRTAGRRRLLRRVRAWVKTLRAAEGVPALPAERPAQD